MPILLPFLSQVNNAIEMFERMAHHGACGCKKNTRDSADIMVALPKRNIQGARLMFTIFKVLPFSD